MTKAMLFHMYSYKCAINQTILAKCGHAYKYVINQTIVKADKKLLAPARL